MSNEFSAEAIRRRIEREDFRRFLENYYGVRITGAPLEPNYARMYAAEMVEALRKKKADKK